MRFLIPGHSFLMNDTDFGDIESALKSHQRFYTAEYYIQVIKNGQKKNKFNFYKMKKRGLLQLSTSGKELSIGKLT